MGAVAATLRRPLVRYVLVRIAWMLVLLFVISLATFALLEAAPGSLVQALLGDKNPSPAAIEAVKQKFHLDQPFLVRYFEWLKGALHGNFGTSVRTSEPVSGNVSSHAAVSLELASMAFVVVVVVGGLLGIFAALRRGRAADRLAVGMSVVGVSVPPFATAIVLLYLFAVLLPWFPSYGAGSGSARVTHLILPAIALALTSTGLMVKVTRAAFARELDQDYVVAALARGISFRYVLWRYVFRNALVPILTVTGLILGFLIGGAVLVEAAFSLPGLGLLLVHSVGVKDMPVVLAVTLVIAFAVLLLNLLVDLLYAVVDPRVRMGGQRA
jgi:peptide/nickel transport system permease protein